MSGRQFHSVGQVAGVDVTVAYESFGTLNARADNAVLVQHALTGDSHAAGPSGPDHRDVGWWDRFVGPNRALDTNRYFVLCPNVFGGCRGTTGPSSTVSGVALGSRFPRITVADQVEVEHRLVADLGIRRLRLAVGLSMGGHRTLEWLIRHGDDVGAAVLVACSARPTALQIASRRLQTLAITSDPQWCGGDYHDGPGPVHGLGVARRIAFLHYRSEAQQDVKFGNRRDQGSDRYAVEAYLDHQAARLTERFDAGSYVALTDAMTSYDAGAGRGGLESAVAHVRTPTTVVGFSSDPAYPVRLQHEIADSIPSSGPAVVVDSDYGHDGFLVETEAMTTVLTRALADTACDARAKESDTVTDASTTTGRRPLHRNAFQPRERTTFP